MIFLVDDDPIQNLITSQLLSTNFEAADYKIFNNGKDLLEYLKSNNHPELILLDINMPIMDGWEFLEAYGQLDYQSNIVMLTSSINDADYKKSSKYDFVKGYYTKPLTIEAIKGMLDSNSTVG